MPRGKFSGEDVSAPLASLAIPAGPMDRKAVKVGNVRMESPAERPDPGKGKPDDRGKPVEGETGKPEFPGKAKAAQIKGTDEADLLIGTAGKDRITGGAGDDTLSGGAGHDVLKGGKGVDTYLFGMEDVVAGGHDVVIAMPGNRGDSDEDAGEENEDGMEDGGDPSVPGAGDPAEEEPTAEEPTEEMPPEEGPEEEPEGEPEGEPGGGTPGDDPPMTGSPDRLDFSAELDGVLMIGGTVLSSLTADTALAAELEAGVTNIALVGNRLLIDLNGDGRFTPTEDYAISLPAVTSVTWSAADGWFLLG